MIKKYSLIFLLISSNFLSAQEIKFGKVTKEELQEKYNPLDSSACATYLYSYRKTFFDYQQSDGFRLVTEIHHRIKVYNPEGFNYVTKAITLYKENGIKEDINGLKAYTYNLIDGKVEADKLKKDAIFETEVSKFRDETKFTMPNIKVGSVIEYKYKITSPFTTNVDAFIFQHDIPIKQLEAKFEVPEYYVFKLNIIGFLNVNPEIETKRGKISFTNKTRTGIYNSRTEHSASNVEFSKKISKYNLFNIPALKEEPYINNINNYQSSVKYELSSTKFPNSSLKFYSTTWKDVVKNIYKDPNFGSQIEKSGYYEKEINNLIGTITDPNKKIALIYDFVKSKVKWNGYYGKYTNDGVRKAYKSQVGNVAEINLMLTSMLRYAGLNANPVLVSTRNNGIPIFPTREGYNYVISCIETSDGIILLDATSKYSSPNVLPFRTLNWEGRIIRENGSSALIDLYPNEKSSNIITLMVDLEDNGDINGTIRTVKTNHKALNYREAYIESDEDQFIEELENKYNGMEVSAFVVKNEMNLSKPVMETYKFFLESQADVINDKIFVSPLLFLRSIENPFKLEKREFPVDFGYPSKSVYRINIKLPEGYIVELIPKAEAFALPNNLGKFKYIIAIKGNIIQLTINSEINESIIPSVYYETLKEYFGKMIEKENEKIVLSKKIEP